MRVLSCDTGTLSLADCTDCCIETKMTLETGFQEQDNQDGQSGVYRVPEDLERKLVVVILMPSLDTVQAMVSLLRQNPGRNSKQVVSCDAVKIKLQTQCADNTAGHSSCHTIVVLMATPCTKSLGRRLEVGGTSIGAKGVVGFARDGILYFFFAGESDGQHGRQRSEFRRRGRRGAGTDSRNLESHWRIEGIIAGHCRCATFCPARSLARGRCHLSSSDCCPCVHPQGGCRCHRRKAWPSTPTDWERRLKSRA